MTSIIQKADETATELGKLYEEFRECNSDRSMVQLRHFVVGKNEMPARQWLQVITELRIAWNELQRMMIDRREQQRDVESVDEIRRDRALLRIQNIEYDMEAKEKECGKLLVLRDELKAAHGGTGYTNEEIEDEEKAYYTARLRHQSVLDMASRATGIGVGNLQSMEQLGVMKLDVQNNKVFIIENLGLFPKRIEEKVLCSDCEHYRNEEMCGKCANQNLWNARPEKPMQECEVCHRLTDNGERSQAAGHGVLCSKCEDLKQPGAFR